MRVILDLAYCSPTLALALEEAILAALASAAAPPTLRVWRNPRCVVIGRGQAPDREADLIACRRLGVPVVQRGSGGGAVYHHPGNLNFSLFLPLQGRWRDARDTQEYLACLLAQELVSRWGLPAYTDAGGVYVDGLKVSGSAQLRRGALLHHGTLLVQQDHVSMDTVLLAHRAAYVPSAVASRPAPVTSLSHLVGRTLTVEEGVRAVLSAYSAVGDYVPGALSLRELARAFALTESQAESGWTDRLPTPT